MKKVGRGILVALLGLLLVVGSGVVWLQTASGQDWLARQAVSYLRKKLKTKLDVSQARFSLPDWIELRGVYIEDLRRDTLLAGGRIYADLDVWGLLQNRVGINEIQLEDIRLKAYRTLPDTAFNFQFIINTFTSQTTTPDTTSAPLEMRMDAVLLRNVRLSYQDAVVGTDAEVSLPDACFNFSAFNPSLSRYHLTNTNIQSGWVKVKMYTPIRKDSGLTSSASTADSLDLELGTIRLGDYRVVYEDRKQQLKTEANIGKLEIEAEKLYLTRPLVVLKKLGVKNTGIAFQSGDFKLDIQRFATQLEDFQFTPQRISGRLKLGSWLEKRRGVMRQLRADFMYTPRQLSLQNLLLQTNETLLQNRVVLNYASLEEFSKNVGNVGVDVCLTKSQLGFKDVLAWMPALRKKTPFAKNPTASVKFNGLVQGRINDLNLKGVDISTLDATRFKVDGRIKGLPDPKQMALDLLIAELSSSRRDLQRILPDRAFPSTIELPENLRLSGKVQGSLDNLRLDTQLASDRGGAAFAGNLKNFVRGRQQEYNGTLSLKEFDVGKWLKQSLAELGKISLKATVVGQGIDPKTLRADLAAVVEKADLKGYVYQNLEIKGSLRGQLVDLVAAVADSNLNLKLTTKVDLRSEYPSFSSQLDIQTLRLKALHLYEDEIDIKGGINANFTSTDPEDPRGTLQITNGILAQKGKNIPLQNIWVELDNQEGERLALINTPFLKAKATGTFRYIQLADVLLTEISRYFALPDVPYKPVTTPYRLSVEGKVANHPALQVFVPELTRMDTVRFMVHLNSQGDTTLMARIVAPRIDYDSMVVNNADFGILGIENQANYVGHVDTFLYDTYQIKRAAIEGQVANSLVGFNASFKDSLYKKQHELSGTLASVGNAYRLQLAPNGFLLDYKPWKATTDGFVQFGKDGLLVQQFDLQQNRQRLLINTTTGVPNGPLRVEMDSLDLASLTALVMDSLQISGKLGGNVLLQNYTESAVFTGDLGIEGFQYTNIPIGDLKIRAANESASKIVAEATLKSPQNDVRLSGNYLLKSKTPFDFEVDIRKLGARTIEAFSAGQLRRATGALSGKAQIRGAIDKPKVEGEALFDSVSFNVTKLGATYRINNSRLQFVNSDVFLKKFIVKDTLNQPLQVDGKINWGNLPSVAYDLTVEGKDFTVLNASRIENDFLYGKGIVDAKLHIEGVGTNPTIDGSVKLKQGSDITVIMPDDDLGKASTEGIVEFINKSDSTAVPKDSLQTEAPLEFGAGISLNLEADDRSQLTIVVDELNGDNLKVKGNAQLNAGITPEGQPYILGLYELTQGSYNLTFEILKRDFTIQKGSRLLWTGDPMKADVDITAVYPVTADLTPLQGKAAKYGKVPLEVLLKMQGSLSNPQISFEVRPDPNKMPATTRNQIEEDGVFNNIKDPVQMNKQVFSLLVLNKFIGEQSSDFFSSVNPEVIARQSVSKLLTDQLNLLASDLIKGVKLNFDVNSTAVATASGSAGQTDLNVGLSKAFLNERLTVNVGRNFEIESGNRTQKSTELVDNVNINYDLTRDGRYAVRAYRKNQYQTVLEGFIVETGVSFAIVLDYETFKEMFKK